ncbi:hypothetical protein HK096_000710, partial [Nowakowskiella sp. JEL0078]
MGMLLTRQIELSEDALFEEVEGDVDFVDVGVDDYDIVDSDFESTDEESDADEDGESSLRLEENSERAKKRSKFTALTQNPIRTKNSNPSRMEHPNGESASNSKTVTFSNTHRPRRERKARRINH